VDTVVEQITVEAVALELERPLDPDALVDESAFARDEFLPYWASLWPSGVALAHHVARLRPTGVRVVELGCGLGLPSLVAARLGADVTALDWSPDAVSLLRRNAERNGVRLESVVADWRTPGPAADRRFPMVLAADVLYEQRNAEPLLELLERIVEPGGAAYVADPGRRHAPSFLAGAAERGWQPEAVPDTRIPNGAVHVLRPG
jgi:predicted nicotinamide N-methyase